MRHTEALREPTRRERFYRWRHGVWPDSYVNARLTALALDEAEAQLSSVCEQIASLRYGRQLLRASELGRAQEAEQDL